MSRSPAQSVRDDRLDFWRGLCLIDMVLVHLVYAGVVFGGALQEVFGEYLRFAAGGFVMLSGACVGAIFLPKALDAARRPDIYRALWRRSAYILGLHYAATAALILLDILRGHATSQHDALRVVLDIVLWRQGGDLLPLYVIMLAVSPALLEIVRRGFAALLLAGSLGLFLVGQHAPWALSTSDTGRFPLMLWQFVFVLGMVLGTALPGWDALRQRTRASIATGIWVAYAALALIAYRDRLGLGVPTLGLEFHKVPLSLGELLRYVTLVLGIVTVSDLVWRWIGRTGASRLVARMGRFTLALYLAHLFVQEGILELAWRTPWLGAGQASYGALAVAVLAVYAVWLERRAAAKPVRLPALRWPKGWGSPLAGSSAACVLLLVAATLHEAPPLPNSPAPTESWVTDGPTDIDDVPPTDRNHDRYNDLLGDPVLPEREEA